MAIPVGFLQIVLQDLQHSGLVISRSGPKGGYALGRPPESITVCEVVESLEGPLDAGECALRGGPCHWDDVSRAPPGLVVGTRGTARTIAVGHTGRSGGPGQGVGRGNGCRACRLAPKQDTTRNPTPSAVAAADRSPTSTGLSGVLDDLLVRGPSTTVDRDRCSRTDSGLLPAGDHGDGHVGGGRRRRPQRPLPGSGVGRPQVVDHEVRLLEQVAVAALDQRTARAVVVRRPRAPHGVDVQPVEHVETAMASAPSGPRRVRCGAPRCPSPWRGQLAASSWPRTCLLLHMVTSFNAGAELVVGENLLLHLMIFSST